MQIKFIKYKDDVEIPQRKYPNDTGADIKMSEAGQIAPYTTIIIPLDFGIDVPNGHTARLQARTSVARQGIFVQGCAIDAGYTGNISIILHNISDKTFYWSKGDRLCYIEVYPVQYPEFVEDVVTRGKNSFGSTGK